MSRLLVPLFCILICFSIGAESIPPDSSFVPPCCTYEETPQLLHAIEPDYPDSLQELNIQGDVGLWLYINAQGSVDTVRLVQSVHPTLDRAAIESLQNSRWLPALQKGVAVATWFHFPVHFLLPKYQLKISHDENPRLENLPPIEYPSQLQRENIQGDVMLDALLTTRGELDSICVQMASHPTFEQSVIKAVKKARWKPARFQNQEVSIWISIVVTFDDNSNFPTVTVFYPGYSFTSPYQPQNFSLPDPLFNPPSASYDSPPTLTSTITPQALTKNRYLDLRGNVDLWVHVDTCGTVQEMKLALSLLPSLDQKVLEAVQQSTWEPARKNGKIVDSWAHISLVYAGQKFVAYTPQKYALSLSPVKKSWCTPCSAYNDLPIPIYIPQTPYPNSLKKSGIEGTTMLTIHIRKDGRVDTVQVSESVNPVLDQIAVISLQNSRWLTAKESGKAAESWVLFPICFELPSPPTYKLPNQLQAAVPFSGFNASQKYHKPTPKKTTAQQHKMTIKEIPLPEFR